MVSEITTCLGRCRLIRVHSPRYVVSVRGRVVRELEKDTDLVAFLSSLTANDLVNLRVSYLDSVRAVVPVSECAFGCGRVVVPVSNK